MSVESRPSGRQPLLERMFGAGIDPTEGDDEAIQDQTGNEIHDQEGRVIFAEK